MILGEPALHVNDILNMGIATTQGDFATQFGVAAGPEQVAEIWK